MEYRSTGFLSGLVLTAAICSAQPARYIEIKLPPEVKSESFFIRYVRAAEDFGGWVQPLAGVSSYIIDTGFGDRPAKGIKAILYAPGCAIQTLDLPLSGSNNPQWSFVCEPVRTTSIDGALFQCDRLYGRAVKLQAKYVVRWAQKFLGLDDVLVTTIPVGEAKYLPADGRFRLTIPEFAQAGEIQIWAKDATSGATMGRLIPIDPKPVGRWNFASSNPPQAYDRFGFALRPEAASSCDR